MYLVSPLNLLNFVYKTSLLETTAETICTARAGASFQKKQKKKLRGESMLKRDMIYVHRSRVWDAGLRVCINATTAMLPRENKQKSNK